jgi:serine phosphatase RsbU (regulator of sigma subunit)
VAEHVLTPGSTLMLYTDGLLEAYDDGPERLGHEGLCRLLTKIRTADPPIDELASQLVDAAEQHNGGPLHDDVAMLLVTFRGAE